MMCLYVDIAVNCLIVFIGSLWQRSTSQVTDALTQSCLIFILCCFCCQSSRCTPWKCIDIIFITLPSCCIHTSGQTTHIYISLSDVYLTVFVLIFQVAEPNRAIKSVRLLVQCNPNKPDSFYSNSLTICIFTNVLITHESKQFVLVHCDLMLL